MAIYYLSPGMGDIRATSWNRGVTSMNKKAVTLLVSLLFLAASFTATAKATLYDGRDGLNSNDISAVAKDTRGMMWIGTFKGLNIYDGYTFTRIPGVLSNRHITALAVHPGGNELFVGTKTGLYIVDLRNLQTTLALPVQKAETIWSSLKVTTICVAKDSIAYIAFGSGYLARVSKKHTLELICKLPDAAKDINDIVTDDEGLLVNSGNLYRVNPRSKQVVALTAINKLAPFNAMFRHGSSLLLNSYFSRFQMVDIHGFTDIMPPELKKKMEKLPFSVTRSLLKDDQLYLLGTNYNFCIINLKTGQINELSRKYPDIFEGKVYYSLFIDEHNIMWIATNKGLIKVEERPTRFTRELYNVPGRVSTRRIIEDDNGDIYVASYTGLWQWSRQSHTWSQYVRNPNDALRAYASAFKGSVLPFALLAIPGSNYIYIGYDSEQLFRFDKKKKIFEAVDYKTHQPGVSLGGIFTIVRDKKGILWLGCGYGLASYDPESNTLTLHQKDAFDTGPHRIRYIAAGNDGNTLFVASVAGLYVVDPAKGITARLNAASQPALSSDDLLFAEQDEEGHLWIGTNGGGINVISPDLKRIQYIRKKDGLSNEIVYSILRQDRNTYWISTFNGLDRYRKDQRSFSNFFEEDGLSSNEFNQNSFLKTGEGKMYFGSINGITSFDPSQFNAPEPFHIFASGLSQWDEKTQSLQLIRNKIDASTTIIKKPSDLLLELHFGCTDYSDPLRNSYSYRIRELSDNWVLLEDRHTLNLGGIPYGYYTIEVKAINSRGVSSANMLTFHVKVVQPFYKTWWFFSLILCGLAVIFYSAYQIKYQGFKNILHLRMKIASNLHDEVGSLLTRITMFSDNLRYSRNTEEQRNAKLEKIAVLSRDAIASMSDVLWTIDSRNDFAGNLLDRMREHAEEMLFPLGIDVNFVLSGTDLKQPITSDTRGEIYLIFKEAIHNIAKHSQATKVDIVYQIQDKNFLLRIINNKASGAINGQSTGQGLSNMKMRAAKVGAKIKVQTKGDQFIVEVSN
jgi:ligand-binding sensor domain-containing protein